MKKGSHSRHTYPADKMIPKELLKIVTWDYCGKLRKNPTAVQRKCMKKFHTRKQRIFNKKLIEND